jgi:elongator complex protein 6
LTLAADEPLLHAQVTTLEREHAALVLGQAHAADTVLALRMLDTGTAKDVSGVVRITAGGGRQHDDEGDGEGREYLYFVAGDGNVRVFERGT